MAYIVRLVVDVKVLPSVLDARDSAVEMLALARPAVGMYELRCFNAPSHRLVNSNVLPVGGELIVVILCEYLLRPVEDVVD